MKSTFVRQNNQVNEDILQQKFAEVCLSLVYLFSVKGSDTCHPMAKQNRKGGGTEIRMT